jgi:hypothetical protein
MSDDYDSIGFDNRWQAIRGTHQRHGIFYRALGLVLLLSLFADTFGPGWWRDGYTMGEAYSRDMIKST